MFLPFLWGKYHLRWRVLVVGGIPVWAAIKIELFDGPMQLPFWKDK